MSCGLALQSQCFMHEPPPSSSWHAFHAALEGAWGCLHQLTQEGGSENLHPTSLPERKSGSSSAATLRNGPSAHAPPWTAPLVRLSLKGRWNPPAFTFTIHLCPASQPKEGPVPFCNGCLRHCNKKDMVIYYWPNGCSYERNPQQLPILTVRHTLMLSLELSFS